MTHMSHCRSIRTKLEEYYSDTSEDSNIAMSADTLLCTEIFKEYYRSNNGNLTHNEVEHTNMTRPEEYVGYEAVNALLTRNL